jgi:hypothetical protein
MINTPNTSSTLEEQIDFFLAPPLPMQSGDLLSSLHLVRREIQDCLIGDVVAENLVVADGRRYRLFATTMMILTGIDLLAKFYDGADNIGSSGRRFQAFAEQFLFQGHPRASQAAEVLYCGYRNPLIHSFTLHSKRYQIALVGGTPTSDVLWLDRGTSESFMLSVEGLFTAFVRAVRAYDDALRGSMDLQAKFRFLFHRYGYVGVQRIFVQRGQSDKVEPHSENDNQGESK